MRRAFVHYFVVSVVNFHVAVLFLGTGLGWGQMGSLKRAATARSADRLGKMYAAMIYIGLCMYEYVGI